MEADKKITTPPLSRLIDCSQTRRSGCCSHREHEPPAAFFRYPIDKKKKRKKKCCVRWSYLCAKKKKGLVVVCRRLFSSRLVCSISIIWYYLLCRVKYKVWNWLWHYATLYSTTFPHAHKILLYCTVLSVLIVSELTLWCAACRNHWHTVCNAVMALSAALTVWYCLQCLFFLSVDLVNLNFCALYAEPTKINPKPLLRHLLTPFLRN